MTLPNESTSNDTNPTDLGRTIAVRCAMVAGFFSIVVCLLLALDYGRRRANDPLDSAAFLELKKELQENPDDATVHQRIRSLDLNLRTEYFRQRRFTHVGVGLLTGCLLVLYSCMKWSGSRRLPLPSPKHQAVPHDMESRSHATARWTLVAVGTSVVLAGIGLTLGVRSRLPKTNAELAALIESRKHVELPPVIPLSPKAPAPKAPAPKAPVPKASPDDIPTDEEIARNWPRFRGPGGLGISHHKGVPTQWSEKAHQGIFWKTEVLLPGYGSPIVWGNRVFLSGATEEKRQVFAFDADTGKLLWRNDIPETPRSTAEPFEVSGDTGFAASTMATDGQRLFAIVANGDVAAFDFDGNLVWGRSLGVPKNGYGFASSLTLSRGLLFIQFDQGNVKEKLSKMLALDVIDGTTFWETARDVTQSWPSPIVIDHAGSRQLITASDPWLIAYNPDNGQEIWRANCLRHDVGPSPVYSDGFVYVANEYPCLSAVRPDGQGDVTETHIRWTGEDGMPDTASPLATEKHVFLAASHGILTCYNAKTGDFLWDKEFEDATLTSSPSLVGERIYLFGEVYEEIGDDYVPMSRTWILEPGSEDAEIVAECSLEEGCVTSPAFQNGRIYIRGRKHLYCLGEE